MVGHHTDEQGDDALDDERVALRLEVHLPVDEVGLQPHTALAALDQVGIRLVGFVQGSLFIAQVDEQLVSVHPVVEVTELGDDFVL